MKSSVFSLAFCVLLSHFCTTALADESSLKLPDRADAAVELTRQADTIERAPSEVLQVYVGTRDACCAEKSPMAGRYQVLGRRVTFEPAFDFVEGQSYVVRSRDSDSSDVLSEFMIAPVAETVRPGVVALYPGSPVIPANTLRFYLYFSTPMKPHAASEFIRLVDADGVEDTAAFMSFKQELWSEDRRRLTLLMDPGRIKRGVARNLEMGPALQEGARYTLVVKEGWPSAIGVETAPRFERAFTVTEAMRTLPDTALWDMVMPRTSSLEPLVIEFDRPFDHALAQIGITVLSPDGSVIPGAVVVENHEKTWRFEPQTEWSTRFVQIDVDPRLEDVAGNNFSELLDHAVGTVVDVVDHKRIILKLRPL